MRRRWSVGLMAILGLVTAVAIAAPTRSTVDCAAFRAEVQKYSITINAGDWAKIPAPLRALPRGATACGSGVLREVYALRFE